MKPPIKEKEAHRAILHEPQESIDKAATTQPVERDSSSKAGDLQEKRRMLETLLKKYASKDGKIKLRLSPRVGYHTPRAGLLPFYFIEDAIWDSPKSSSETHHEWDVIKELLKPAAVVTYNRGSRERFKPYKTSGWALITYYLPVSDIQNRTAMSVREILKIVFKKEVAVVL